MSYEQHADMSITPNVIVKCIAQESIDAQVTHFATETIHLQQRDGDTQQHIGQEQLQPAQHQLAQRQHRAKLKLQRTHPTQRPH